MALQCRRGNFLKRAMLVLPLTAALGFWLQAGTYYQASTLSRDDETGKTMAMVVKSWVDGEKAKIEFVETGDSLVSAGNFLITTDGGQTIFLVDPREKNIYEMES